MIRFGYFGDGPWAHRALETLLADNRFDLAFVVARRDRDESVLRAQAARAGVPFLRPQDVNSDAFLSEVAPLEAALFVSMSYDQIFKRRLIETPPLGIINCHAGALPRYRGRNVLNWALINGETHIGVSVHYVEEGIDTGDLIKQVRVPVAPDESYKEVLARAVRVCAQTLYDAMRDIAEHRVVRTPQEGEGFYCGVRRDGDEWLDWTWTSERLHNFIRGIAPPAPGARTLLENGLTEVVVTRARLIPTIPAYLGTPGEVVGRTEGGVLVKTGDTALELLAIARVSTAGDVMEPKAPRYRLGRRFVPTPQDVRLARLEARLGTRE